MIASLTCYLLRKQDFSSAQEYQQVEWAQAGFLAAAALVNAWRTVGSRSLANRYLRAGLSLFCASMLLREVDIDKFGEPPFWDTIELGLRLTLVAGWIWFGILALKHRDALFRVVPVSLLSWCCLLNALGCLLYAASYPFDKFELTIGPLSAVFLEQTLELNATIMFLFAAFTPPLAVSTDP
ncbi:MAG: hypothetical protein ACNA8P_13385 [Phycisphaerales bacterium]